LKNSDTYTFTPYHSQKRSQESMMEASRLFYQLMNKRRSVRQFSSDQIPDEVIENIIRTAGTAPSGANKQPWTFCVVRDVAIKKQIREAAELEEERNYAERMNDEWLKDLKPLGTDAQKEFLEIAPVLIVVFKKPYDLDANGAKQQNYYVNESVGIACGILISAIHHAGLVTLTHTPSPMNFLEKILNRPTNERAYLLLPVGYPSDTATVPNIQRKELHHFCFPY
jgi:iodotyrosine deiodinase